jgi:predicted metal-dependent hydrolase
MNCTKELPSDAIKGILLFNSGNFFEAHEALEAAWRAETEPNRFLYQGILQLGVGYYHLLRGNINGAGRLFARARETLRDIPSFCQGVDVDHIRTQIIEAVALVEVYQKNPFSNYHFPLYSIKINKDDNA